MEIGPTLTSIHNPTVAFARSLKQKRARYRARALLLEGSTLVFDSLTAGTRPSLVFIALERVDEVLPQLQARGELGDIFPVSERVLKALAETETPQGLVAVVPFPQLPLYIPAGQAPLVVVADGVRDPGNLGALIRSALGAGAHGLLTSPETVDPFSPKVMRAGMGAQFRLPIHPLNWERPQEVAATCEQRLAAEAPAAVNYARVDWTTSSCLIVGNETRGLSDGARHFTTGSVSIPLHGGLESLNAAVAGSIILFEAARQRRRATGFHGHP